MEALCPKVYELEDSYEQAGPLLAALCEEAARRGYDVVACPSPEEPGRLEHLLIPELGVAFVTSRPGMAYPGKPYRRVRLDALSHPENKARLRFRARMAGVLREEGIAALQEAKAAHDLLEGVYNPYVDFEGVRAQAALEAGRLLSWMKWKKPCCFINSTVFYLILFGFQFRKSFSFLLREGWRVVGACCVSLGFHLR